MGGSSPPRRQRSTSATRRRRAEGSCEPTNGLHGFSSYLIWILATSSTILVISPNATENQESTNRIKEQFRKMYPADNSFQQQDAYENEASQKPHHFYPDFPNFARPQGIRFRDDRRLIQQQHIPLMPILTEHRSASPFGRGASTSMGGPTTSYGCDSPSLEDLDLIDVLWRGDIAAEKGTRQVAPAEQYECDLQTLTEKSTVAPLTAEEAQRYEDLSKGYYQGFYPSFATGPLYKQQQNNQQQQDPLKSQLVAPPPPPPPSATTRRPSEDQLPTDKDLADLLEDVSREEGQLNLLFEDNKNPVLNDVSLSEGIVYSQANLTEMQELHDSCNQISISPTSSSTQPETLFNSTDAQTIQNWIQPTEMAPNDVFPQSGYNYIGLENNTMQAIISNGHIDYDHGYQPQSSPLTQLTVGTTTSSGSSRGRQQTTQTSPTSAVSSSMFDQYNAQQRHSFSDCNTDSSSPCSRLSSESPRYNSESSSSTSGSSSAAMHESRFYGKLIPAVGIYERRPASRSSSSTSSIRISRVVPLAANGQRKRGRQSKDEQLALENALPVSAHEISEMSLSELQTVLKTENLSEFQRNLIRRIRRRGKNKVAARTCRQRRTDRHDRAVNMNYI